MALRPETRNPEMDNHCWLVPSCRNGRDIAWKHSFPEYRDDVKHAATATASHMYLVPWKVFSQFFFARRCEAALKSVSETIHETAQPLAWTTQHFLLQPAPRKHTLEPQSSTIMTSKRSRKLPSAEQHGLKLLPKYNFFCHRALGEITPLQSTAQHMLL